MAITHDVKHAPPHKSSREPSVGGRQRRGKIHQGGNVDTMRSKRKYVVQTAAITNNGDQEKHARKSWVYFGAGTKAKARDAEEPRGEVYEAATAAG